MHLNGDILKKSHDDTVGKRQTNFLWELEKQRVARLRPHKEIWLQTDTGAGEDSLQRQRSDFAKLQKDGGQKSHEPIREQLDTNSQEHLQYFNTDHKPAETEVVAKVRIEGKSNQRKEAGDVKSCLFSSDGFSSSIVPCMSGHMQTQITGCNYSPNLCNSSKRDKEILQHVVSADSSCRLDTTQTVTKGGKTASCREKRNAIKSREKAKKEPWK